MDIRLNASEETCWLLPSPPNIYASIKLRYI